MSRGAFYIASGDAFIRHARVSAKSLKKYNPNVSITIYTDEDIEKGVFDNVINIDSEVSVAGDSILTEDHIKHDKNLYLDADTYICGNISEIFDLLDRGDLAMAHNNARHWWNEDVYKEHGLSIPDSFPEYNSGVIAFNDSPSVRGLFKHWQETYESLNYKYNQPALRSALYNSEIEILTLTPEYNFMNKNVSYASGKVKIIHHQGYSKKELDDFSRRLNRNTGRRVITFDRYPFRVVTNKKSMWYKIRDTGVSGTIDLLKRANEKRKEEGVGQMIIAGKRMLE
ncbi:glycosyltransferase family protein [Halostella salina]|uniref:hypothetical protein n=1 Tax=Halostella salina TaxID=1547897 RepID=UPI0013CEA1A0|nr:hypothetical protein [Halostella salina]